MSTLACVFAICAEDRALADQTVARVAALERFFAPTGLRGTAVIRRAAGRHVVGQVGGGVPQENRLVWGAPFGASPPDAQTLLRASDAELQASMSDFGAAFAFEEHVLRMVTAPSGPVALYAAQTDGVRVWSTHALAAGWLASGRVALDASALPEYLAYDFVGGDRTFITGVRAVGPARCIDVAAGEPRDRCFWPAAQRWSAVAEDHAHDHAEQALLGSLEARTGAGAHVALGLTAGADSRVLALALDELGVRSSAFVWGEPDWPDVVGASRVADELGMSLAVTCEWRSDAETARSIGAEARWCDGVTSLATTQRSWPPGAGAVLVGMAGEVGRAFYYERAAAGTEPVRARALADVLAPEGRLPAASDDAHARARAAVNRWVAAAAESGHGGWRQLDVLYAEQRVARWGRSQVPALEPSYLTGFTTMQVMRGLTALPLSDRLHSGFHRRFIANRSTSLALSQSPTSRHQPRWRRAGARLARSVGRAGRRGAVDPDPPQIDLWTARPQTYEWVCEEVLTSPLLVEAMGARWAKVVRDGFVRGDPRATGQAMLACGPIALMHALKDLR